MGADANAFEKVTVALPELDREFVLRTLSPTRPTS